MLVVNEDLSVFITRGDVAILRISATSNEGVPYVFKPGDVVRIKVFEKKSCDNVVMQKDSGVTEETEVVDIYLEPKDTKIGDVISKPKDYWYEVELNPNTEAQTIIGYDEEGAKLFKLFPEGDDVEDAIIEEEDIPFVDTELDLTSERPVQNMAIAREIVKIANQLSQLEEVVASIQSIIANNM